MRRFVPQLETLDLLLVGEMRLDVELPDAQQAVVERVHSDC